ncbi:MAG: MATE family efflux transporter [Cellulosilyticaceae bacterium]
MEKRIDLTEGHIMSKLVKLSLPIMGTSFIQMAYNMTDMIWIGRVGSDAVAAVGTAGFFTWLAMAFVMISKIGAEIKVSQSIGKHDIKSTRSYIQGALQINVVLALGYMAFLLLFYKQLIGFFNLGAPAVIEMAETYLIVVGVAIIFFFLNPVFTAIFNGLGDSKTPFKLNTIGLIFNMVFDPLLIFGGFGIPAMGVMGAALATVMAQMIVTIGFIIVMIKRKEEYLRIKLFARPEWQYIKTICQIGLPGAVQSGLFTLFSMELGRVVAIWGPVPIAVQKVGSQIEAISWMTAGGLSTALGTFVGQNFGAGKKDRIEKGTRMTLGLAVGLGIFASVLLIFFGGPIFSVFLPEQEAVRQGVDYLMILGLSQIFMCIEITVTGAFNGLGRTYIPSIITIVLTGARIPMAYILSRPELLGLNGIWWSISISSILKGIVLLGIFMYLKNKNKLYHTL